jgi:hypothetical protein
MAYENVHDTLTFEAGEDLSAYQYHAICLDDGELATTGEEAAGVLLNKPASNQHGAYCPQGVSKFKAGEAITKGQKLRVTTSGWFVAGCSGFYIVGEALAAVTSGSIGTGNFFFPTAHYLSV